MIFFGEQAELIEAFERSQLLLRLNLDTDQTMWYDGGMIGSNSVVKPNDNIHVRRDSEYYQALRNMVAEGGPGEDVDFEAPDDVEEPQEQE